MPKKETTAPVKAVLYARYSSDRQREESIEGQIRVCEEYAARNNMKILHTYADRALSGRSDQRPEFQMMIRDAAAQSFDVVLVYKLNRFARNRYDSAKYKHKLKKYGVKVVSAMENITDDPSGILLESVIEGMAEFYSAELAENVMRGMTENALECKWPGGIVPLGYKLDDSHHLVIDASAAQVVRRIYRMFLQGRTPTSIIRELNSEHIRTALGKPFGRSSLHSILSNERYIGTFTWHGIRKENAIPQIIDKRTFEAVQKAVGFRKKNHVKVCSENFLLSGKLFCGQCGANMVGTSGTSKNHATYYYYGCSNHLKKQGCTARSIRADKLEDLVCRVTTRILQSPKAVKAIARQAVSAQKEQEDSLELKALKSQKAEIERKLKNCIRAVENGLISEIMTNHIKDCERRLTGLSEAISREELLNSTAPLTEEKIEFFFYAIAQEIREKDRYRSILLSSLVRCVIVYPDCIEIQYNYKNELPILQNPVRIGSSYLMPMVTQEGFEPTTHRLEGGCSIQLSY